MRAHDARRWLAESMSSVPASVPTTTVDSILASPMAAIAELPPTSARLPMIPRSTRHATPAAQSVISEYLASHGYVVAWARYTGIDSLRPPYDDVSVERKVATLEAHVADMQWAIRRLRAHPSVGLAPHWRCRVELQRGARDCSGPAHAIAACARQAQLEHPRLDVPRRRHGRVHRLASGACRRADARGSRRGARTAARAVAAPRSTPGKAYRVSFSSLAHGNVNVLEGMLPGLTGIPSVHPWSTAGPGAQDGYETISRAVLALLDKTLKGAAGDGGFRPPNDVRIERHGPGRGISAVEGTSFVDSRVTITSDGWQLAGDFAQPRLVRARCA